MENFGKTELLSKYKPVDFVQYRKTVAQKIGQVAQSDQDERNKNKKQKVYHRDAGQVKAEYFFYD